MVSFTVVTDSVYSLPRELELIEPLVAEVDIIVDNRAYKSSQLSPLDVLRFLREGKKVTTSAPNPGEWLRVLEKAQEPAVVITVSSRLSASYNNALIAARMSGKEVYVVDSLSAAIGQGMLVYRALLLAGKGVPAREAAKQLGKEASRIRLYLSVGSMRYLARSGRVPHLVGEIGDLLGIHPILTVEDGEIRKHSLARDVPRALASLLSPHEGPVIVGMVEPLPEVDRLVEMLREQNAEVYTTYTSPDIAVHVGPGSYGLGFLLK